MTDTSSATYSKKRIRYAATALFIAQGLCFASWASRLPDIKKDFHVEDLFDYGILMFLIPIGKFIAIPLVGFLMQLIGSKKTVLISITGFSLSLLLISIIPGITGLAIALCIFGIFWNMTDISLNTQAIEVERIYGKPIIATFHASWSLAACVGALVGYLMINLKVATTYHFLIISVIAIIVILLNYKYLPEKAIVAKTKEALQSEGKTKAKKFHLPETLLIQLGLVWLLALIVENTMFEWSDLYFQSVIRAPESLQIGFLVFMVMMFVGRMLTNYAYTIWKKKTVLQIAGFLIFIGFTTSSLFIGHFDTMIAQVVVNSIGFMLIGLGISCVVPTIYSIVGDKASTPISIALTIMSSISFIGPLIAPLLVGAISNKYGMEWAYLIIGLFGLCIIGIVSVIKVLRR